MSSRISNRAMNSHTRLAKTSVFGTRSSPGRTLAQRHIFWMASSSASTSRTRCGSRAPGSTSSMVLQLAGRRRCSWHFLVCVLVLVCSVATDDKHFDIGEMHCIPTAPDSFVHQPRFCGGIAYVAQEPWILQDTVRVRTSIVGPWC